jgi:hypothetical protein
MTNIELLARILNTHSCEGFLLSSYKEDQPQLDELINSGLLFKYSIKSEHIFCNKCDEPHYSTVMNIKKVLKWRCPETGFHDVDLEAADRDLYKVNLELLINKIQDGLELKRAKFQSMKTEIEGLYNIAQETLLYISEQNPLADDNLHNYIHDKKSRSSRGMVLCTFEDFNNRPYELPRDYKLVPFDKVVFLNDKDISIKFDGIYEQFSIGEPFKQKKKVGRPSTEAQIANAMEALYDQGGEFATYDKTEKARAIHVHLGKPKTPSFKTIYNHLTSNKKSA